MAKSVAIAFDIWATQPMGNSPVSGGGTYGKRVFLAVLSELEQRKKNSQPPLRFVAIAKKNLPLDPILKQQADLHGVEIWFAQDPRLELLTFIEQENVRVFFSPLPLRFRNLTFPAHVCFIYTIHGLRPLELLYDRYEHKFLTSFRELGKYVVTRWFSAWYLRKRTQDFQNLFSCAQNYHVITVSTHSQYALLAEYPELPPSRITTCYSPTDDVSEQFDDSVLSELGVEPQSYFLLICANRWAKNPYRALLALKRLNQKGLLKKKVIVTGRGNAQYLKKFDNNPTFIITDYLPNKKLQSLYRNAFGFIFPTLNEGFGYPPLECMRYGTPVITSPINSLPELLEHSVLWADPFSIRELESRILRFQEDTQLYESLKSLSTQQELKVRKKQQEDLSTLVELIINSLT